MKLLKKMGIEQPVYYAEIDLDALLKAVRNNEFEFEEICKYPAVSRDLALLLDKKVSFEQVEQIAFQTEKKLLKRVELFDVYEGKIEMNSAVETLKTEYLMNRTSAVHYINAYKCMRLGKVYKRAMNKDVKNP